MQRKNTGRVENIHPKYTPLYNSKFVHMKKIAKLFVRSFDSYARTIGHHGDTEKGNPGKIAIASRQ